MPYGNIHLGNIGSGNGLLADGAKPLPGVMFVQTYTSEKH